MNFKKCNVFFDFDNTITTKDVIDDMLARFSKDDAWKDLEVRWKLRQISTKECLEGQINGLRVSKMLLDKYLRTVPLDPYFRKIVEFLSERKVKTMILTDNFDHIVKTILQNHAIRNVEVLSNKVRYDRGRWIPSFPHKTKDCPTCAHCKKKTLRANLDRGFRSIFIGDGMSDICASKCAKIVFAKANLISYLKEANISFIPYKTLKDVYRHFRRGSHD